MPTQGKSSKRPRFDFTDQSLECQLRFAAKYNSLDKIYHLVAQENADINNPDYNGHTPIIISILEGQNEQCIELLCQLGADVDYTTDRIHGYCPLHFAAERNQADVIKILIEYGALRDCQTFTGCTPLHLAAMNGNIEAVRLLCLGGVDVNIPEWYNGYTPLHYAIVRGHVRVVYLLLEFNASLTAASLHGHTALTLCEDKESDLWEHLYYVHTEPKVLEKICIDVIRKHYLWPNVHMNVLNLPLPSNIKNKILLEEYIRQNPSSDINRNTYLKKLS